MFDTQKLLRAQGLVVVLAFIGIGLFLLIYALLDGTAQSTRLFASLCLPPLLLTVMVGSGVLYLRTKNN